MVCYSLYQLLRFTYHRMKYDRMMAIFKGKLWQILRGCPINLLENLRKHLYVGLSKPVIINNSVEICLILLPSLFVLLR
jgi:hypothetical protein